MALIKKKTEDKEKVLPDVVVPASLSNIILRPRITEKASAKAMADEAYVFEVARNATKKDIKRAIKHFYKVSPLKISVTPIPTKSVYVRGKYGRSGGGKKAYVYLKKGDKIEMV